MYASVVVEALRADPSASCLCVVWVCASETKRSLSASVLLLNQISTTFLFAQDN